MRLSALVALSVSRYQEVFYFVYLSIAHVPITPRSDIYGGNESGSTQFGNVKVNIGDCTSLSILYKAGLS